MNLDDLGFLAAHDPIFAPSKGFPKTSLLFALCFVLCLFRLFFKRVIRVRFSVLILRGCMSRLRWRCTAGQHIPSLVPEASAKKNGYRHQRNLQKHLGSSEQRWTKHIKFGAGGTSENAKEIEKSHSQHQSEFLKHRVWCRKRKQQKRRYLHQPNLQNQIESAATRWTRHIKFGAEGANTNPE